MKKALIIILILISILFFGCSEPRYTSEEWQKIQENSEFQKTKDEIIKFDTEYNKIKKDISGKTKKITDFNKEEALRISNEYIDEFEKLYIPEPLDDFYDKLIEYWTKLRNTVIKKKNNTNYDILDELDKLKIEMDRTQREVYREYDLEYLLK